VTLSRFLSDRTPSWDALEALLRRAGSRPERLGTDGVLELGALYRAAAADLAHARRAYPGDPVVARLELLVRRGRSLVYARSGARGSARRFFSRDYWILVRALGRWIGLASVALLGTALVVGVWAALDPAVDEVPRDEAGGDGAAPPVGDRGLASSESAAFSSQLFTNNIRVTFMAFVAGLLCVLPGILIVAYNGAILGAVMGVAAANGNLANVLHLIVAHGVLELSCIVVAAGAGMAVGWAVVDPGEATRRAAVRDVARPTVLVVLGTMPFLVLCGVVEGFVSPAGWSAVAVTVLGVGIGGGYWALVWRRGAPGAPARTTAMRRPAPSPAAAPARG
jgi:uncharacterized membrane protein SpoIIM required for sporulation